MTSKYMALTNLTGICKRHDVIDAVPLLEHTLCVSSLFACKCDRLDNFSTRDREVQVGKDQEKAQSEKDSHSKNRGGKKTN